MEVVGKNSYVCGVITSIGKNEVVAVLNAKISSWLRWYRQRRHQRGVGRLDEYIQAMSIPRVLKKFRLKLIPKKRLCRVNSGLSTLGQL